MYTHALPRLILVGCLFAITATGAVHAKTMATAGTANWSESVSGENEFVQACSGFDITTSYTSNKAFHIVENYAGDWIVERLKVNFVGSLENAKTGQLLSYDGRFTRTSYFHVGQVMISDLELQIELPTPGDFAVKIAQQEMDLVANPIDVIHAFALSELKSGICVLLDRDYPPSSPGKNLFDLLDMSHNDVTPWTELDLCDTSPPGQACEGQA